MMEILVILTAVMVSHVKIDQIVYFKYVIYYIGIPHFIALCFITLHRSCIFFYNLKVCGNPEMSKSMGDIFPTASAHFVSLCRILLILTIFKHFHCCYICYCDLGSVLSLV